MKEITNVESGRVNFRTTAEKKQFIADMGGSVFLNYILDEILKAHLMKKLPEHYYKNKKGN